MTATPVAPPSPAVAGMVGERTWVARPPTLGQRLGLLWQLTAMSVMQTVEYRGAFFIYMFNTVLGPVITLLVWLTVSEQGVRLPYDRSQFVTYYVMLGLVSMLTSTWLAEYLAESICLGKLSTRLLRPAPLLLHYGGNNLGEKVVKATMLLPMVGLTALVFRDDMRLPTEPGTWLVFALAVVLAGTVSFLIDVVVGSTAFWIEDVDGLLGMVYLARRFLAGELVPLALFPAGLMSLIEAQPFRYTLSFPLEVLTGGIPTGAVLRGFVWEVAWCIGLWLCYRLMWRYGLRAYSAVGA